MANSLYTKARTSFFKAEIQLLTDDITVALASAAYVPDIDTDQFFSSVSAAVVGTPALLAGRTLTEIPGNTVFDADDVSFTAVSGDAITQLVIYQDTGVDATSRLIALIDTASGLPKTPTGGDIALHWNADGIFSWAGCEEP